ncbi:hypothetical protein AB0N09_28105 [Streptomyces erythrochromogenes]|uniref:hypothetical protein n=1 Tax=Streptomyces erythrochromogenes TaxID=285574 RepID=UPI003430B106
MTVTPDLFTAPFTAAESEVAKALFIARHIQPSADLSGRPVDELLREFDEEHLVTAVCAYVLAIRYTAANPGTAIDGVSLAFHLVLLRQTSGQEELAAALTHVLQTVHATIR